jgi:hypothetical protein
MDTHPHHDRPSLDTCAFALLLSAMLANTLLWAGASVLLGDLQTPATTVATTATPSHLQGARL